MKDPFIVKSLEKCKQLGLNPSDIPNFVAVERSIFDKRLLEYREILSVVNFFMNKFLAQMQGVPILVVITDMEGLVLEIDGDKTIQSVIEQLGFKTGFKFDEQSNGNSAVSLALENRRPIKMIGDDHYHEFLHSSVCYTVPFLYRELGDIIGTISVMTSLDNANDLLLTLLTTLVDSIERELLLLKNYRQLDILNKVIIDEAKTGIVITDAIGNITHFNNIAEKITGMPGKSIVGKHVVDLGPIGYAIQSVIKNHEPLTDVEMIIENDCYGRVVGLFDGMPIFDNDKKLLGAVGKYRDITERFIAEEKINYLAHHDDLTGLPNRRLFHEDLKHALNKVIADNSMLAVLMLDLDRFKMINDTLGHSKGDILLGEFGKRIEESVKPVGVVYRMGGDEFIVLLPKVSNREVAIGVAEKITDCFKVPFVIEGYEFDVTASIGLAFYPFDGTDINNLLKHADTAMYRAKKQGRNNFLAYTESMNERSYEKLVLKKELRKGIDNDELVLHYQPQIDLRNGEIIGIEALVRWNHPNLGLLPPARFIPLAEEAGLIISMGEWVLRKACSDFIELQKLGLENSRVAVNLSTFQFLKPGLVNDIRNVLAENGLDPGRLELEITESMTMDVERALSVLRELKNVGVEISIDDFGTGYSSLGYLHKFPINRLKIDRSFITDILTDENERNIVSAIVTMAQALGLEVIAEGVETTEQVNLLKRLGCNIVQGYYFFRPLSLGDLKSVLTSRISKQHIV